MPHPSRVAQLPPDDATANLLLRLSNAFLASRGVLLKPRVPTEQCEQIPWLQEATLLAPVALTPSPLSRNCFNNAVQVHPAMSKLYRQLSKNKNFIHSIISTIIESDPFTKKLYDIFKATEHLPGQQTIALDINRSDYLLHSLPNNQTTIKQVEFNTISISFSSLSAQVGDLHKFLAKRIGYTDMMPGQNVSEKQLPPNESLTSIADGLASAFNAYGSPEAVVLIIGQVGERNLFDQQWIEIKLFERHGVKLIVRSLDQVLDQGQLKPNGDKQILVVDGFEVAVAYYRSAYTPVDYPTEKEWDARLMIEKSFAIKCPTIAYQLVGTKKVQQVLATPGVLEQHLSDKQEIDDIRSCFVELSPLDQSEQGIKAYETAMAKPDHFVLKPQREGGGFNTYGKDIPAMLKQLGPEGRKAYILMQMINAPSQTSVFLRNGQMEIIESISELGIYGICLADGDRILINKAGGHLLRSKPSESNEGGVASGYAVLDSPCLID